MADIHYTAEVFIVHNGKVLLRMHDKYKIWLSIGGHIEANEDPVQAALREVKEEVGLDVTLWEADKKYQVNEGSFRNLVPPAGLNIHCAHDGHEHVTFVYFATSTSDMVVPEKSGDEWRWVTKEEVETMELRENIREYVLGALDTLRLAS